MCQFVECQCWWPGLSITLNVEENFRQSLRSQFGSRAEGAIADTASLQRKAQHKFGETTSVGDSAFVGVGLGVSVGNGVGVSPGDAGCGGVWWVTERALQQSTPWQVALLKASWFGDTPVADLCCGIGGDTFWLAQRGPVVAVDLDAMMVRLAEANCRSATFAGEAKFIRADAISFAKDWNGAIHIDPDRRAGGKRTSSPDYYLPAWSDVTRVVNKSSAAIVKLAPAADVDCSTLDGPSHRTWISLRGSVREQSLLAGDALARAELPEDSRSAIAIRSDGSTQRFSVESQFAVERRAMIASEPGDWMIDPDPAIRAAGLTDAFANTNGLRVIGSPSGFLTTASGIGGLGAAGVNAVSLGMAIVGRVEWSGSCDERRLKKEMRARSVYPAVVKVRGVDRDPIKVIRTFRDCGDRPVTLWLGSIGKKVYAAWTTARDSEPCIKRDPN